MQGINMMLKEHEGLISESGGKQLLCYKLDPGSSYKWGDMSPL